MPVGSSCHNLSYLGLCSAAIACLNCLRSVYGCAGLSWTKAPLAWPHSSGALVFLAVCQISIYLAFLFLGPLRWTYARDWRHRGLIPSVGFHLLIDVISPAASSNHRNAATTYLTPTLVLPTLSGCIAVRNFHTRTHADNLTTARRNTVFFGLHDHGGGTDLTAILQM